MSRTKSSHRIHWLITSIVLCLVCGCHWRHQEECCPTDIKDTYGPFSSEAVRRTPCGPDWYNFGVKPTLWRCGPSDHPPSPGPCPDGNHVETNPAVPPAPEELVPVPGDNMEPMPPPNLPAPSFPATTGGAVRPIGQQQNLLPGYQPGPYYRGGVQQASAIQPQRCLVPMGQSCYRVPPQCRVGVPCRY